MITETVLAMAALNAVTTIAAAPALLLPRLYAEALARFAESLRDSTERSLKNDMVERAMADQPRRPTPLMSTETCRAAA